MFKTILEILMEVVQSISEKNKEVGDKVMTLVEEIGKLEIELAEEISNAERWGDLSDDSHWRTAKVNKLKRMIESKNKMISTLGNIRKS